MAGKISWKLELDGGNAIVKQLREIDRLFSSIDRTMQSFNRGFGGGGAAGMAGVVVRGGGGGGGGGGLMAAAAALAITQNTRQRFYSGPAPPWIQPQTSAGTASGWGMPTGQYWQTLGKAITQHMSAKGDLLNMYRNSVGESLSRFQAKQTFGKFNWNQLFTTHGGNSGDSNVDAQAALSVVTGLQKGNHPKDIANMMKHLNAQKLLNAFTHGGLGGLVNETLFSDVSNPATYQQAHQQNNLTNAYRMVGGLSKTVAALKAGHQPPPIIPNPSSGGGGFWGSLFGGGGGGGGGGSGGGGGGGFWSKLLQLDGLSKHFLALFSIVKLLQKAFEFLKHTVQETSNIYRTAAMTGHGLGAVAGITNGLGSIGMDAGSAQTLLLNAQFRKGNQTSLYDTALGAGRSVGSKGLIQQIENMKPYLDNWEHSMKRVDDALAENSKMAFELTFVWHKFTVSLTGVVSDLVTSAGPQLISVLGNLATALKYLGQVMHFVNSIDLVSKVTTWMNKQQGFIPGSVPDFKQSFGNKAGNSNLSGWERMGLVINSGVGHESHLSEISKNTKETAVTLKQLFSKEATFGDLKDYFKQSFNAP